mmetsp:Transcript_14592/g.35167  ORF Transcript_14592/g.35167 Transcript_14592/m.35167 type:complete len:297 (+) Transcript_14592:443-1333(+)
MPPLPRTDLIAIRDEPIVPHYPPAQKRASRLPREDLLPPRQHARPPSPFFFAPKVVIPRHAPLANVLIPRALEVANEYRGSDAQFEVQDGAFRARAGSVVPVQDGRDAADARVIIGRRRIADRCRVIIIIVRGRVAPQNVRGTLSVVRNEQRRPRVAIPLHQYLVHVVQFRTAQVEVQVAAPALEVSQVQGVVRTVLQAVPPQERVYLVRVTPTGHETREEFHVRVLGRTAEPVPHVRVVHRCQSHCTRLLSVPIEPSHNIQRSIDVVRRNQPRISALVVVRHRHGRRVRRVGGYG